MDKSKGWEKLFLTLMFDEDDPEPTRTTGSGSVLESETRSGSDSGGSEPGSEPVLGPGTAVGFLSESGPGPASASLLGPRPEPRSGFVSEFAPVCGPRFGPGCGPRFGPGCGQRFGPGRGPKFGPAYGPRFGPAYGPRFGPACGPGPGFVPGLPPEFRPRPGCLRSENIYKERKRCHLSTIVEEIEEEPMPNSSSNEQAPKRKKSLEQETQETMSLSTNELQRLVFLEQLKLLRMQQTEVQKSLAKKDSEDVSNRSSNNIFSEFGKTFQEL